MSQHVLSSLIEPVRVNTTSTQVEVTAGPAVTALAANPARKYLLIQNQHAGHILYVSTDGGAATAADLAINPGIIVIWDVAVPKGAISLLASDTLNAYVSEGV